jgi:two-component system, OmpR family, phosphate regulon response regulator PhoB
VRDRGSAAPAGETVPYRDEMVTRTRPALNLAVLEQAQSVCGDEMAATGVAHVPTILLVDEEPEFRNLISFVLHRDGFHVVMGADGHEALTRWEADEPDLLLLGARLAGLSGIEVCRRIRRTAPTPIIVVAPKPHEATIIKAFAAGADDVLAKPFGLRQLGLRIRAILRRVGLRPEQVARGEAPSPADVTLDAEVRELRRGRRSVHVTPAEYRILSCLMARPGRVVSHDQLIDAAYGDSLANRQAFRRHIHRVRRKLRLVAGPKAAITVVPRVGYCISW